MKNLGANTLLVSAIGAVLKLASDTTLPVVIRSLAALVTCAIAGAIVVYAYRQERGGQTSAGARACGRVRAARARGQRGRTQVRHDSGDSQRHRNGQLR